MTVKRCCALTRQLLSLRLSLRNLHTLGWVYGFPNLKSGLRSWPRLRDTIGWSLRPFFLVHFMRGFAVVNQITTPPFIRQVYGCREQYGCAQRRRNNMRIFPIMKSFPDPPPSLPLRSSPSFIAPCLSFDSTPFPSSAIPNLL